MLCGVIHLQVRPEKRHIQGSKFLSELSKNGFYKINRNNFSWCRPGCDREILAQGAALVHIQCMAWKNHKN
jgi:hypothetical protein